MGRWVRRQRAICHSLFAIRYSLLAICHSMIISGSPYSTGCVLHQDLDHRAITRRRNLIHRLHRLDDNQRLAGLHLAADVHRRTAARRAPARDGRSGPWAATSPGCCDGWIGTATAEATTFGPAGPGPSGNRASRLTSNCGRREPTLRRAEISISVRPVSSSNFASSRIMPVDLAGVLGIRRFPDLRATINPSISRLIKPWRRWTAAEAVDRECITVDTKAAQHGTRDL